MSDTTVTAVPAMRRWRIEVAHRADLVFPLRDYLRRLGLPAEVEGPTLVELTSHEDPAEIEEWASNWSRKQGTPLNVEEVREQSRTPITPSVRSGAPRLGTLLVDKGYLTPDQLATALAEAHTTRDLLGVVLLRNELIFEDELARTLSQQLSIPYVSIGRVGVDASIARLLPAEVGAAAAAIPVRATGATLQVAFADPTDAWALEEVGRYLPRIEVVVAELSDIRLAWRSALPAASWS